MPIFWATPRVWQSSLGCSKLGLHFSSQKAKLQFGLLFEAQDVIRFFLNILNLIARGEE